MVNIFGFEISIELLLAIIGIAFDCFLFFIVAVMGGFYVNVDKKLREEDKEWISKGISQEVNGYLNSFRKLYDEYVVKTEKRITELLNPVEKAANDVKQSRAETLREIREAIVPVFNKIEEIKDIKIPNEEAIAGRVSSKVKGELKAEYESLIADVNNLSESVAQLKENTEKTEKQEVKLPKELSQAIAELTEGSKKLLSGSKGEEYKLALLLYQSLKPLSEKQEAQAKIEESRVFTID